MRNTIGVRALVGALGAFAAALPGAAWGYGVELPENGATAFGRGGAFIARASDPSAVMHNVAAIVGLPGFQLTLSSNMSFFSHCFQRSGNYEGMDNGAVIDATGTVFAPPGGGTPAYASGRVPYPEVCKGFGVGLAPMLMGTYRINRYVGIGFGVYAPSTQGRTQHFGNQVDARDPMTGMTVSAPSPARNLLYQKDLLVLHPVIAVSVQPTRWLRVGLGIEPSIANFVFGLNANGVGSAPQSPSSDVFIQLDATGFFMAGSVAVQALPTPFLSAAVQFHYNFPIDASGTGTGTGGLYAANPMNRVSSQFDILSMRVTLPWTLRAGVRYNMPRPGRPTQDDGTGTYDPMTDDVFDVEAMFTYENTSDLSETSLTNRGNIRVDPTLMVAAPPEITIRSALSNVMGFRLGGDYNIIPGTLAVRAGGSYETAGVSPDLAQIHLPAYAGFSLHAGVTYRHRWLSVSAGYGHFFFQDNDATNAQRAVTIPSPQIDPATGCDPARNASRGVQACTINRGVYTASMDSVSIQFSARF